MENIIEISNLSVYYDRVCALDNISFNVKRKDFLAVMGPNGGGKSTLLKVMLGLIQPSNGTVKIFGQDVSNVRNRIGYVPQFSNFSKRFPIKVVDVVLMGRLYSKIKYFYRFSKEDWNIADKIMKRLGIHSLRERQIGELSGGQLQRVLIARALVRNPEVLLLDEPTASLDTTSKTQIYELLKELNKDITIIVVSHDMGAVSSYVYQIACLNQRLHYHGEAELNETVVQQLYGCPVDLIAHGVPHRVLKTHEEEMS